ncbi:hypothetical protein ASE36_13780 [Rhizobium sp. Root274]|uniref:hypothetical protein n=1 Tax=unclassified Rhizobium TaxID=2613769 RepID=UPI0007122D74|nr:MULTISPECIES: hypothetical protein [unclassified Rhizobium]KQW29489.1 hypothetical protein ASC71_13800 [Rhizobium sp. Root1240]KRD29680.1 hypothetical protein ASE36_13780 [Rhizobium sp. Root274]
MSNLSYQILPNDDDNTYEVRFIVDGTDWIGDDHLGLDPPDIIRQLTQGHKGNLIIGRCSCGCMGCDDVSVHVRRAATSVEWSSHNRATAIFDADYYDQQVSMLSKDFAWEPLNRTVERHLDAMFSSKVTDDGYRYDWASTRIKAGVINISVTKEHHQKLLEFSWDGTTIESAMTRGRQLLKERFVD